LHLYIFLAYINYNPLKMVKWREIAARKQDAQKAKIPRDWLLSSLPSSSVLDVRSLPSTCGLLTPTELDITSNHDATSLVSLLATGRLTSVAVTTAFCKRAAIAHQLTNCLTEIFFDRALERAKDLDAHFAKTGKPIGPLHGLPVSLKDTFNIAGLDSCIGIAALANNPAKENAPLVDLLLAAGAVLYVKTNIPQTLMALDSTNNVFGRVLNPSNRLLTAGGSSGGEGALIALRGSVLGVGTDVGGSIRVPAMCNGLVGVKPSAGRVPFAGQQGAGREGTGRVSLGPSAGPIANNVRDCELFLKVVAEGRAWERDPDVVFGSWESQGNLNLESDGKPIFGVLRRDGVTEPLPPVQNVLDEAIKALRNRGFEVVEISAPAFSKIQSLTNKLFGVDGNHHVLDLLASTNEPLIPWLDGKVRRKAKADHDVLVDLHEAKSRIEKEMLGVWKDDRGRRIDAILCPVAPHPVPPVDGWGSVGYTSSWVLLDCPAGVLPVRTVRQDDLGGEIDAKPVGSWDAGNRKLCEFAVLLRL
jgi:amidase